MRLRYALMALIVAIGLAAGVLLNATAVSTADACRCPPTCHWVYYQGHWVYICGCDGIG
ncbi:MAG: hypothetical protein U0822_13790 [Anaerolineae bacterium]